MVVAFVGFVGGGVKSVSGPDSLALAGIAGATIATVFTFLPSVLFILIGSPGSKHFHQHFERPDH